MIDEKFYLDKKLLALTKNEIKFYRTLSRIACGSKVAKSQLDVFPFGIVFLAPSVIDSLRIL